MMKYGIWLISFFSVLTFVQHKTTYYNRSMHKNVVLRACKAAEKA